MAGRSSTANGRFSIERTAERSSCRRATTRNSATSAARLVNACFLTIPGGGGGTYPIRELEELDDRVVVHVGDPVGQHAQGSVGEGEPLPITGYVFLDD